MYKVMFVALCSMILLHSCKPQYEVTEEQLSASVFIPGHPHKESDYFSSTVSNLIAILKEADGVSSVKVKPSKPITYTVSGKDTTTFGDLRIDVQYGGKPVTLLLRRELGDFESTEYPEVFQVVNGQKMESLHWFQKLFKQNKKRVSDLSELKGKALASYINKDLLDVYTFISESSIVSDLEVYKVTTFYLIEGKLQERPFIVSAELFSGSSEYDVQFRFKDSWFYKNRFQSSYLFSKYGMKRLLY